MNKILYENFNYIAILLICLINAIYTVTGTGNTLMGYGKLKDEDKELYDISKVKMSQILYILSFAIVTVLAFVFSEIYPDVFTLKTFIVCYLVEIIVLIIFSKTKWILNWFCKKK